MSVQEIDPELAKAGEPPTANARDGRFAWAVAAPWFAATAAIAFVLGPLLAEYGRRMWAAEHYRFFPMLLAAAAWLAWRRYQTLPRLYAWPSSQLVRAGLWAAAFMASAIAVLADSPLGAAVALLAIILAGLYEWGGWAALRHFLPVWGVLLLAVRLPFNWDQKLIVALQRAAAAWASGTLDLLRIRHLADGVVIRLPERDFFIEEACSGVHSLFATVAFLAVFSVVMHRGFIRFLLLLAASVFWVLVANALRVLAVVILSTRYNLPVVDGVGHEVLGIVIFAFVIGLVLSTDRLFLFILPQRDAFPEMGFHGTPGRPAGAVPEARRSWRLRSMLTPAIVTAAFVALAVGVSMLPSGASQAQWRLYAPTEGLAPVPEAALPATWQGWQRVEFVVREREKGDPAGEISRIWFYRKGRLSAAVSIDGPFDGWHDTQVCYDGLGYTTQSCEDLPADDGGDASGAFTELSITGAGGEHGYVLFMAYSETGVPLRPPASRNASIGRLVTAWRDRMAGKAQTPVEGRVFQVQLFSTSGLSFTAAERSEMTELFHTMRTEIARVTKEQRTTATAGGERANGKGGTT